MPVPKGDDSIARALMKPQTDRRLNERFDVVGTMWVQLELTDSARVRNASTTGALVEAPRPSALGSVLEMVVMIDGHQVRVDGRVRHAYRLEDASDEGRYLIGLEFSFPPESVIESIEHLGERQPAASRTDE